MAALESEKSKRVESLEQKCHDLSTPWIVRCEASTKSCWIKPKGNESPGFRI